MCVHQLTIKFSMECHIIEAPLECNAPSIPLGHKICSPLANKHSAAAELHSCCYQKELGIEAFAHAVCLNAHAFL